jgi:hypothetical protein
MQWKDKKKFNKIEHYVIKQQLLTSVLQDCGVSAFLEILVLIESSGIFSNFGAKNPQPRKALGRYTQCKQDS